MSALFTASAFSGDLIVTFYYYFFTFCVMCCACNVHNK